MISSMKSSMIERSALAPVSFSSAFLAIERSASSSNSSFTSSSSSSLLYCFRIAFFGSFKISTSLRLSSVNTIGRRPRNSGTIPKVRRSSKVTCDSRFLSPSYLSFRSAWKPMEAVLFRRSLMMSVRSGKAPPQIKRMFLVLTVSSGTIAFLLLAPTGTSMSLPSRSFSIPCCTASPLTSLWFVFFFFAILSISSMKMIPCSARSTSLSAAAKSLDTTLSISSPI